MLTLAAFREHERQVRDETGIDHLQQRAGVRRVPLARDDELHRRRARKSTAASISGIVCAVRAGLSDAPNAATVASARARSSPRPVNAASRARLSAATELALGSAPSWSSFNRSSTLASRSLVAEVATRLRVVEKFVLLRLELLGPGEMRGIEPGLVQVEQSLDEKGVIIGKPFHCRWTLAVGPQQDAIGLAVKVLP